MGSIYYKIPTCLRKHLQCIPVYSGGNVLDKATNVLKNGYNLCIFPEGKRTTDGKIHSFKRGYAELHKRTGVPILSATISGAYNVGLHI